VTGPRRRRSFGLATVFGALTVVAVAGCATVVQGAAARDPDFHPGDAVPALLNPGNYPTTPSKKMGTGGADGAILEGQRMADFVVGPWEVDPTLLVIGYDATMVWKNPAALQITLAPPAPDIAGRHQFLVGFGSGRASAGAPGQGKALTNGVLRFPSPADATAAATEMGAPSAPQPRQSAPTPFPVPGHPEAVAVSAKADDGTATVESYTPHGTYVFYDFGRSQDGNLDTAAGLVAKAIDLQGGRIDGFTPTDPAKFADLPIDPTGLLARTLPPPKGQVTIRNGSWGPQGALHFAVDPVAAAKIFTGGDLVQKTFGTSMVFESKDAAGAKRFLDGSLADPSPTEKPVPGVPGLPSAKCSASGDTNPATPQFTCTLLFDRYVAVVASAQLPDAHQQAAAQYLMLTAT
jgi:hypothetical protein